MALIKTTIYVELEERHKDIYYFDSPEFLLDGYPALIVETKSSGSEWFDVIHTIKWKGAFVPYAMQDLISLKHKGRLK